jgi:hypothetical protein
MEPNPHALSHDTQPTSFLRVHLAHACLMVLLVVSLCSLSTLAICANLKIPDHKRERFVVVEIRSLASRVNAPARVFIRELEVYACGRAHAQVLYLSKKVGRAYHAIGSRFD